MISALVVEDDYRVARIHRATIERVDGFTCVGEAHTAAQAREIIIDTQPDLLLLDIYLPDEDGLSLLRSLSSGGVHRPDCIIVTASRDLQTIGSAMQSGAIYYLVKPFGLAQLRDQLEAYRRWRERLESPGEADQETVDQLYSLLRKPLDSIASRRLPPTMQKVLDAVLHAAQPVDAVRVAQVVGVSRPTAQRYLADLEHRRYIELQLEYGATGRPVHLYRAKAERG
jgi:response regulator of citrate/malate metabolism